MLVLIFSLVCWARLKTAWDLTGFLTGEGEVRVTG